MTCYFVCSWAFIYMCIYMFRMGCKRCQCVDGNIEHHIISILTQPIVWLLLFVPQIEATAYETTTKKNNYNSSARMLRVAASQIRCYKHLHLPVSVRNYNKYLQTILTWAQYLCGQNISAHLKIEEHSEGEKKENGTDKWKQKRINNSKNKTIIIEAQKEQIQCIASHQPFFFS